ncbi:YoaK family protein [Actinocorallia populi]|uniref:YoaK family protein n=1 Tax=Actinocorallia populi TaxID=2079200 RepID=UPI000D0873D1|nr:YoaK family protein [Actinocorallia populi]
MSTRNGGRTDGPLPFLFTVLAFTTGMIDAMSFLALGGVFVAAMTGNVIILGLSVADLDTALSSALSLLAFAVGAGCGGQAVLPRFARRHRGLLLAAGTAVHAALVCGAAVLASRYGFTEPWERRPVIVILAFSLGWEYAIARALKVSDLNPLVVTTTLNSLFAESVAPARQARRLVSICALLAGAVVSSLLHRKLFPVAPLWAAGALLTGCAVAAYAATRLSGAKDWD